ncbi:hypothetical protein GCM10010915_11840 [Microbacterium faecale]|uniref:Uncharacterized protein n=1 Tax=Microbacterium faecale TaxID=1804630 RepID=A0A917DE78_9MICO|nr:hypothetical protein [Microbacterium faecale]GGD33091.1 hypothetical protein GCM10010915_11840 [Microbacterium faecale]
MADAPEVVLNRALAQLLHDHDLAVYKTTGAIPERGIRLDGVMPTTIDEFTLLTPLRPVADGRANMTYRTQVYTRRLGSPLVARTWAADLRSILDQTEYTPRALGISWTWEFSSMDFDPDSQGRSAVACTYHFSGRR